MFTLHHLLLISYRIAIQYIARALVAPERISLTGNVANQRGNPSFLWLYLPLNSQQI